MSLAVAALTFTLIFPLADPADDDLAGWLEQASRSEFSGRQVVLSWTGEGPIGGLYPVGQTRGMAVYHEGGRSTMLGKGTLLANEGSDVSYVHVDATTYASFHARYQISSATQAQRRPDHVIEVRENGQVRARFVFDDVTSALVAKEVYDGAGSLYRYSALVEFSTTAAEPPMDLSEMPNAQPIARAEPRLLPTAAGGYERLDAYAAPAGGVQAFYSDGLFSFSVFELDRKVDAGAMAEAPAADLGGVDGYRMRYGPGLVWVYWTTSDDKFVLVGDLPPDHLDRVAADLPRPDRANVLVRAWRWFFG